LPQQYPPRRKKERQMTGKRAIHPDPFPFFDYSRYTFSMGLEKRGLVWISGQTAATYDAATGQMVCQGDLVEQTRCIYEKLRLTLEAAGVSFVDVVKTVDYLVPAARHAYRHTAAVRREYFGQSFPAATGVVVEHLLRGDALIEVEAIAQLGTEPKEVIEPGLDHPRQLTYRPAVAKRGVVWISGHTAQHADPITDKSIYPAGVVAQTRAIYAKVSRVLAAAGASFSDVIKMVEYVAPAGLADYAATQAVRWEYFGHELPASTMLVIKQLLHPEALIEIDLIAVTGSARKTSSALDIAFPETKTGWLAVRKGPLLCISGQLGLDPHRGALPPPADLLGQTCQAYANVQAIAQAAGASLDDIVKTVECVTPPAWLDYRQTAQIRRQVFREPYPAATGVVIPGLMRSDCCIVVDAVAVVD
jgi:enamine deaminase RidA (YjgF/YER057c/UK114 family)